MALRSIGMLFAVACVSFASTLAKAGPAHVGLRAPFFELESLAGETLTADAFAGRPLYVNVFATWCPPCRLEMPLIATTLARYKNRVAFLAVDAQESKQVIQPYLAGLHVRARVAIDRGQFAATYGARSIPQSIFIDRHGIVRAIVNGPIGKNVLERDLARIAG